MGLFVLVEPNFKTTSSCSIIFSGLRSALRKKRIQYKVINDVAEIEPSGNQTFLIIVSTNMMLISNTVAYCDRINVHPIILSQQFLRSLPGVYSDVTSDIRHSMRYIMSFLKKIGKNRPALYGISESSFPDLARRDRFLEEHVLPTSQNDIFYNKTTLDDCFKLFFSNIDTYDCVICPNDYVAIHLVNSLKTQKYPIERFKIISYGQLMMASKYHPEITSIFIGYENFGKAAITIYEELQNNPDLLYMSLSIKNKINIESSSSDEPLPPAPFEGDEENADAFYKDPDIKRMILIEKLLNSCDGTDLTIFDMLLNKASYEEIALNCFLSISAIKYRIRRMFSSCGCSSRNEFVELIGKYI